MSIFEGISFQPLGSKKVEDDDNHPEPLGQDDAADNAQQTSSSTPGPVLPVATSRWKTFFITVAILFANGFLYTGISVITPFYPIMVSCVIIFCMHVCMWVLMGVGTRLEVYMGRSITAVGT